MKRILLCLVLSCLTAKAQNIGTINSGFNVDGFPNVSFEYHSYSPEELTKSDFQYLSEGGENRDFKISVVPENRSSEPHTTLILWEDMANHGRRQFNFTQKVLLGFFDEVRIPAGNQFAVSVFNRRENRPYSLTDLTRGFSSDKAQIKRVIESYVPSTKFYPEFPDRSDMYSAVREGLETLQPLEGAKSIVVFTAGYPMINSGSDSEAQVLLLAQRYHIPVYIIQYFERSGVTPGQEGFAKSTNGDFSYYKDTDVAQAKIDLVRRYPQMRERYYGRSYKISFTSGAKRGDEARMISLNVRGEETQEQFLPPVFSLKKWIGENVWLFVGFVVIVLGLIAIAIWLIVRGINLRNRRAAENEAKLQGEISESNRKMEELRRRQEEEKRIAGDAATAKVRIAEEERLAQLMRNKNLYPRLQCRIGKKTFTYTMDKLRITLGREADNDVVLNNDKVSRHHAEIVFKGGGFEIVDKGSTNKVIVNGAFYERATLKSGDVVGLGAAVITFYV
jgi:hypothetical protein